MLAKQFMEHLNKAGIQHVTAYGDATCTEVPTMPHAQLSLSQGDVTYKGEKVTAIVVTGDCTLFDDWCVIEKVRELSFAHSEKGGWRWAPEDACWWAPVSMAEFIADWVEKVGDYDWVDVEV